jgi:two-component system response regulator WspF
MPRPPAALRLAIVNDSPLAVAVLQRALAPTRHQLLWVTDNGRDALDQCQRQRPDLILMDVLMPGMDGVEATRQIMQHCPCGILLVTFSMGRTMAKVFAALGHGALDAVSLPAAGPATAQTLLQKIDQLGRLLPTVDTAPQDWPPLLLLGASTGGPAALQQILASLPLGFKAAVLVVQHIDPSFAPSLSEWLDQACPLPVHLAQPGDRLSPGQVLLAGGSGHLTLQPNGQLKVDPLAAPGVYSPSIDSLWHSIALHWPQPQVAVLLTGMGRDGASGLKALYDQSWHTIAQDQATSAIYGMPKAAVALGAVSQSLPLEKIAAACLRHLPG